MTRADLTALLPILVTLAAAVAVMLAIAIRRHHGVALGLTLAGLGGAFACLSAAWAIAPRPVAGLLMIDHYALFYMALILAGAFATALLAHGYLANRGGRKEEFYVLLILATAGAEVLAGSAHFVSLFLGLELLTVSLYALIAYSRGAAASIEAGVKYLVLAGASSAFLLFGMAMVYASLGTMRFSEIAARAGAGSYGIWMTAGLGLMVVGIGFKLAVVPFHLWTPDVYEAPAPVTGFLATVSKGAVFALLLRYFHGLHLQGWGPLPAVFAAIAVASMFAGNLLALRQDNVKRILAYSSIAHLGYLLVAFLAGAQAGGSASLAPSGTAGAEAVTFYLTAYFATTLGAFGVIGVLSGRGSDAGALAEYRGLIWRRPLLGGILTVMLMSLAGIPLTAGFVGKFYLLKAGAGSALWGLVMVLVVNSAIGLYYYLRIIVTMCRPAAESVGAAESAEGRSSLAGAEAGSSPLPQTANLALLGLTVVVIWLGVLPGAMIDVIRVLFFDANW